MKLKQRTGSGAGQGYGNENGTGQWYKVSTAHPSRFNGTHPGPILMCGNCNSRGYSLPQAQRAKVRSGVEDDGCGYGYGGVHYGEGHVSGKGVG